MKNAVRMLFAGAGMAMAMSAFGQGAPASAQVWDIRFDVDTSGPFAAGPNATAVGITLRARVGIVPGTYVTGNFGVSNVGGSAGAGGAFTNANSTNFNMTFIDPNGNSPNQGSIGRGAVGAVDGMGNVILDSGGAPMAGLYPTFRGSFGSTGGDNTNASNGVFGTNALGNAVASGIVGSRAAFNNNPGNISPGAPGGALGAATFDGNGFGVANLVGGYADVYRFIYLPKPDFTTAFDREITVNVRNINVRYLAANNGTDLFTASASTTRLFTVQPLTFRFQVPTPGAAALLGLGGLCAARRRRA